MDIFIALGIFGALLFWVFIITNKPGDPTFIENQTKGARSNGAPLPEQPAGDQHQAESNTAPMKLGGDVAAPLKTTGHAAGRGRPMPEVPELADLLSEYKRLDPAVEPQRCKELLSLAAPLVDRNVEPKKWAAIRNAYANLCESDAPEAAIAAYRDALTVWQPDLDRDSWSYCHCQIGCLLARMHRPGTAEAEQAIAHLECAVGDQPYLAEMLAALYGFRPLGDPAENWRNRVKYLEFAAARLSREDEPAKWAKLQNELALARAEQPGGDFASALEERIERHQVVLAALTERGEPWIETCLHLAEAYLNRVQGGLADNGARAESYLREVLDACGGRPEHESRALLMLGRCLVFKQVERRPQSLHEALALFEQARILVDSDRHPELLASVDKFCAITQLELLRMGERDKLEPLIASCKRALSGFDEKTNPGERRKVLQIEADALFEAGEFIRASKCLEDAATTTEALLTRATTIEGRLERIWELRDSTALLSYCCLQAGDLPAAIAALDRGKARLWNNDHRATTAATLFASIPQNGALLFPVFAAAQGAVIIATRGPNAANLTVASLPNFGKQRVLELQRGTSPEQLGGWLHAYCYRNSQAENFRRHIDAMGESLYSEVWASVLTTLRQLGVEKGAELVWFPQGGSGVFPMHAAWRFEGSERRWFIEDYALRYAPSLTILAISAQQTNRPRSALIVANPIGDLVFTKLETEWARVALQADVIMGNEASKEAVLAQLMSRTHVHFATHADFNLDDPFESSIKLAGDLRLTLRELLPQLKQRFDFVVLSACETAMARVTSTADEFLGFPAALLAHGARTVLATLWPVDDSATAFLVGKFYQEYGNGEISAAEALRRAQNWLRTVTIAELSDLLRSLRDAKGPVAPLAAKIKTYLRGVNDDVRPFADPWHWAAFTLSGASR